MRNHQQKQNSYHSEKGIIHVPYNPSITGTPDPQCTFPDWATVKAQKIHKDIMMDGNLEEWNAPKGTYNELKWRRVTLDKI